MLSHAHLQVSEKVGEAVCSTLTLTWSMWSAIPPKRLSRMRGMSSCSTSAAPPPPLPPPHLVNVARDAVVEDEGDEQLLHISLGDVELAGDEGDAHARVGLHQLEEHL